MNSKSFSALHRSISYVALTIAASLTLSACSSPNPVKAPAAGSGVSAQSNKTTSNAPGTAGQAPFVSQSRFGNVAIERIEDGAQPNDHPYKISAAQVKAVFAKLEVQERGNSAPIFNKAELDEIGAAMSAALGKAGPREDVIFAVSGEHGRLTTPDEPAVTTGRVFVKNGSINVIFNDIHKDVADQFEPAGWLRPFPPGSRDKSSQAAVVAKPDVAYGANDRRDWILIAENTIPVIPLPTIKRKEAAAAPAVPTNVSPAKTAPMQVASTQAAPAQATPYRRNDKRLALLRGLKDKGLITEQEYDEKRQEILKDL